MVKLSDQDRARVVGYVQSGRTELYVAGLFHVHLNTIGNLMRRWRQTGEVKDRPRSGRPRTTSAAEDRLMALQRRATPAPEIRVNIRARRRNGQQGLSVQTVRWSDILFTDNPDSYCVIMTDGYVYGEDGVNDLPTSASKLAVRAMVVD